MSAPFGPLERLDRFMGAGDDYAGASAALFGIPMDFTTSYRPGARFGPDGIRKASYGVEEFSFYTAADLGDRSYVDLGDVAPVYGDVRTTLDRALATARRIVADGKLLVMLGGEHLCTVPCVQAAAERHPDLVLVQLDAHADLRADYLGNPLSHACAIRRCLDWVPPERVYQFGIRSGTREEYAFARERCHLFPFAVAGPLQEQRAALAGVPVYVTVDIDVADPAFAPGTGTPEPGGIDARELLSAVRSLAGLQVVGFDVVEVAPTLDPSDRTAVLAALVIREALLALT